MLRDALTIAVAVGVIGVSFGVLASAKGISTPMACGMSLFIFAGGSQFVLATAAGTSLATAVAAALLLNLRLAAYGLSVASALHGRLPARMLSSYLVVDETTAFALSQPTPRLSRRGFYTVGILLFSFWQAGTLVGALAGSTIGDPKRYGIDTALPAALLAMLWPQLTSSRTRIAAVAGSAIAVGLTPVLRPGLPIMLATFGVVLALAVDRR
jgi:4-azaleucine resistance transporter AzlC